MIGLDDLIEYISLLLVTISPSIIDLYVKNKKYKKYLKFIQALVTTLLTLYSIFKGKTTQSTDLRIKFLFKLVSLYMLFRNLTAKK